MTEPSVSVRQIEALFIALGVAPMLCELLRRVSMRRGWVDVPNRRKSHARPTPLLGGVAIVVSSIPAGLLLLHGYSPALMAIIVGAVVLSLLGLADDIRPLSPMIRLEVEALVAGFVVYSGVRLPIFGNALDAVLTVVWIVLITNSFNLLDNMDGVATVVAIAASAFLAATAAATGQPGAAVLLASVCGGCAGFLAHNWAPAKIFMGDCGSLFIGFIIATSAVLVHGTGAGRLTAVWLATFVPTIDTAVVLISRHRARRPLLRGGTDHISHRLRRLGLSVPQVGLVFLVGATITSLTGLLVARRLLPPGRIVLCAALAAVLATWLSLKVPVYRVTRGRAVQNAARGDEDVADSEWSARA